MDFGLSLPTCIGLIGLIGLIGIQARFGGTIFSRVMWR